MSKTAVWTIIVIIVLVIVGAFMFMGANNTPEVANTTNTGEPNSSSQEPSATSTVPTAKEFTVNGSNFAFDVKTITVNKGDTVTIHFINTTGTHDFVIDEFDVATPTLQTGQKADVTFVADKAGSFEYYCSIGTHRAMGMKGTLIVNDGTSSGSSIEIKATTTIR